MRWARERSFGPPVRWSDTSKSVEAPTGEEDSRIKHPARSFDKPNDARLLDSFAPPRFARPARSPARRPAQSGRPERAGTTKPAQPTSGRCITGLKGCAIPLVLIGSGMGAGRSGPTGHHVMEGPLECFTAPRREPFLEDVGGGSACRFLPRSRVKLVPGCSQHTINDRAVNQRDPAPPPEATAG
jgi:hypothetical protein